jgi:hypothetical protein
MKIILQNFQNSAPCLVQLDHTTPSYDIILWQQNGKYSLGIDVGWQYQ